MQPYSGRVGLVVTRRVPGSAAVEFCEWAATPRVFIMACHGQTRNQSAPCFRLGNRFGLLLLALFRFGGGTHGRSRMSMNVAA